MIPVFDGHNDFVLRLLRDPARRSEIWLEGERTRAGDPVGHLDLPRMKAGGFAGGFFAVYLPSPEAHDSADRRATMEQPPYDVPLPELIGVEAAQPVAMAIVGHLRWMERVSDGAFRICTTVDEIETCIANGIVAAVLHFEGAEAIGTDLDALHVWHAAGLRSLGPVWSRPTVFGHGVPFRFPGSPDTGPGLTDAGRDLVRECNRLRIMLDLSHLNQKGFDDVAALTDAPLVATHSNAHAITPSTRNLTDRQLAMIRDSDGMVGLNYAIGFLREDGRNEPNIGWEPVMRHLDHLIGQAGEDRVGLGSDFDGATVPDPIRDVTGLPALQQAMADHGYGEELIAKLCHRNWMAVLRRTWGG